jgi:hypothetical protein
MRKTKIYKHRPYLNLKNIHSPPSSQTPEFVSSLFTDLAMARAMNSSKSKSQRNVQGMHRDSLVGIKE